MEERLQKALEFANYRQTLNNQLHKIKIKSEGLLMFAKNGGNFSVNQELICFLDYLVRTGITETNILDSNNIPVQIKDVEVFLKEITQRYFEVTNDYLKEYQSIRKLRNVKSIIDVKEKE
jgi:predicted HTH transcriptional regulator